MATSSESCCLIGMLGMPGAKSRSWLWPRATMAKLDWIGSSAARAVWVSFAAAVAGLPIAGVPIVLSRARTPCVDLAACANMAQLTPDGLRTLEQAGWSLDTYALVGVLILAGSAGVWIGVAGLLAWRRPRDSMALLSGCFLLAGSVGVADGPLRDAAAAAHPFWMVVATLAQVVMAITLGLFVALFPDGRWVLGWTRWLPVGWAAFLVSSLVLPGSVLDSTTWSSSLLLTVLFGLVSASTYAQVWRYRHTSNEIQRQRIKWVVVGISAALGGWFAVVAAGYGVDPELVQAGSPWQLVFGGLFRAALLLIPLSIGVAVLRARLWDVEPIVNRTLVYAADGCSSSAVCGGCRLSLAPAARR